MRDPCSLKIERPFAVFFEPAGDVEGEWVAHVVGHELDNCTQGEGPIGAAMMLVDLLQALTDSCPAGGPGSEHDYSIKTSYKRDCASDEEFPGLECTRCGGVTSVIP